MMVKNRDSRIKERNKIFKSEKVGEEKVSTWEETKIY